MTKNAHASRFEFDARFRSTKQQYYTKVAKGGRGPYYLNEFQVEAVLRHHVNSIIMDVLRSRNVDPYYEFRFLNSIDGLSPLAELHARTYYDRGEVPNTRLGANQIFKRSLYIKQDQSKENAALQRRVLSFLSALSEEQRFVKLPVGLRRDEDRLGVRDPFVAIGIGRGPGIDGAYSSGIEGLIPAGNISIRGFYPSGPSDKENKFPVTISGRGEITGSSWRIGAGVRGKQRENSGYYSGEMGENLTDPNPVRMRNGLWHALRVFPAAEEPEKLVSIMNEVATGIQTHMEEHNTASDIAFTGHPKTPSPVGTSTTIRVGRDQAEAGDIPLLADAIAKRVVENAQLSGRFGDLAKANTDIHQNITTEYLEQLPLGPTFDRLYESVYGQEFFSLDNKPGSRTGYLYLALSTQNLKKHFSLDDYGTVQDVENGQAFLEWLRERVESESLPSVYHSQFSKILATLDQISTDEKAAQFVSDERAKIRSSRLDLIEQGLDNYSKLPDIAGYEHRLLEIEQDREAYARKLLGDAVSVMRGMAVAHFVDDRNAWVNDARARGIPLMDDILNEDGTVAQHSLNSRLEISTRARVALSELLGRELNIAERTNKDVGTLSKIVEDLSAHFQEDNIILILKTASLLRKDEGMSELIRSLLKDQYPQLAEGEILLENNPQADVATQKAQMEMGPLISGLYIADSIVAASALTPEDYKNAEAEASEGLTDLDYQSANQMAAGNADWAKQIIDQLVKDRTEDILARQAVQNHSPNVRAAAEYLNIPGKKKALLNDVVEISNLHQANLDEPNPVPENADYGDLEASDQGRLRAYVTSITSGTLFDALVDDRKKKYKQNEEDVLEKIRILKAVIRRDESTSVTIDGETKPALDHAFELANAFYEAVFDGNYEIPAEINLKTYSESAKVQTIIEDMLFLSFSKGDKIEDLNAFLTESLTLVKKMIELRESNFKDVGTSPEEIIEEAFRGKTVHTDQPFLKTYRKGSTDKSYTDALARFADNLSTDVVGRQRILEAWKQAATSEARKDKEKPARRYALYALVLLIGGGFAWVGNWTVRTISELQTQVSVLQDNAQNNRDQTPVIPTAPQQEIVTPSVETTPQEPAVESPEAPVVVADPEITESQLQRNEFHGERVVLEPDRYVRANIEVGTLTKEQEIKLSLIRILMSVSREEGGESFPTAISPINIDGMKTREIITAINGSVDNLLAAENEKVYTDFNTANPLKPNELDMLHTIDSILDSLGVQEEEKVTVLETMILATPKIQQDLADVDISRMTHSYATFLSGYIPERRNSYKIDALQRYLNAREGEIPATNLQMLGLQLSYGLGAIVNPDLEKMAWDIANSFTASNGIRSE